MFQSCGFSYYTGCIRVGDLVCTRHVGKCPRGIQLPPCDISLIFICDFYTVRAQRNYELDPICFSDTTIIVVEGIQFVDTAQSWSLQALQSACSTFRNIDKFSLCHEITSIHQKLQTATLSNPSIDILIPLH